MPMDSNDTLLSRNEANAIKGVLILLVILGHDIPFIRLTDSWMVMVWIYLFHIHCFFLIPFLYTIKRLSPQRLLDLFIRFYTPFLTVFIMLLLLKMNTTTGGGKTRLINLVLCLASGNPLRLKELTGVQFLWFLPAMFMCCIVKEWHSCSIRPLKCLFLLIGAASLLLPFLSLEVPELLYNPLFGFRFLFLGILVRWLLLRNVFGNYAAIVLFVSGSLCFFIHYRYCLHPFYWGYPVGHIHHALRLLMPVVFLHLLFHLRGNLSKIKLLVHFGENSFSIYLFHAFFGYASSWFMMRCGVKDWLAAPICFLSISFFSLYASRFLYAHPIFKSCLMPKGWMDFSMAWKKTLLLLIWK